MTNPNPDPVALEDRLEATRQWFLKLRADPFFWTGDEAIAEIDLHLATLDDASESLGFR